jgi:hypothetical protein
VQNGCQLTDGDNWGLTFAFADPQEFSVPLKNSSMMVAKYLLLKLEKTLAMLNRYRTAPNSLHCIVRDSGSKMRNRNSHSVLN